MGELLGPVVFLVWLLLVGAAVAVAVAVFRSGADPAGDGSDGGLLARLRRWRPRGG